MRTITVLLLMVLLSACASREYQYGTQRSAVDYPLSPVMEQQIIIGKPHAFWDKSDWIWPGSWLAKLFLWNRNVDSHTVSDETLAMMADYISRNELEHVQVLVNHYSPGNQWRRLVQNKTVGAGWRYTFGVVSVLTYTIMPGRFFGGDAYNPYTNTIYLYSDDPSIALHEAGHAKDTGRRRLKGTYSALYVLPFVPLYHEAKASNDALSYLRDQDMSEERKAAYRILHPAYGTYVAGSVAGAWPGASLLGAIPGHITGNIAAAFVRQQKGGTSEADVPLAGAAGDTLSADVEAINQPPEQGGR